MNKKILIVEDDITLRQTLAEFLDAENFSVITASDGEKAIYAAKNNLPDIILLDIILPN